MCAPPLARDEVRCLTMATRDLGKLERVDVRNVWPHEALNFTPWLVKNLDVLSEVVGLQLELVEMEASLPGEGGRVDILAREDATGVNVVIENQLGVSDNDHCTGLLGYAAHSDSRILIWVAGGFTDWHRRIVSWLNQNGVQIYGVEVSVWRIGNECAPYLNLVAGPNRSEHMAISGRRTAGQQYRDFFQPLIDRFRKEGITDRLTALAANDHAFPSGVEGITYDVGFWSGPSASTYLWIATDNHERNKYIFDGLYACKDEIERELGEELHWERKDNQRMSAILLSITGAIDDPPENLEEIRDWMAETLPRLKLALQQRLEAIVSELD